MILFPFVVQYRKYRHLYWKHLKIIIGKLILKQLLHKIYLEMSHQLTMANPKIKETICGHLPKVLYLHHYQRLVVKISKKVITFLVKKEGSGIIYHISGITHINIKPIQFLWYQHEMVSFLFVCLCHCPQLNHILGRFHNFLSFTRWHSLMWKIWFWLKIFQYHPSYFPLLFTLHHLLLESFT